MVWYVTYIQKVNNVNALLQILDILILLYIDIYINNKVTQKKEIVYLVMERSSRMETAMDIELFVILYAL